MLNTPEETLRVLSEQANILDLVHDAIILRDRQGVIVFWNRGAEKLFGWTSDEALGKQANTLLHTQFLQPLEAIESEVLRAGHWEGELIRIHRDGTPLVVISRWDLWRDDDTSPIIHCGDQHRRHRAQAGRTFAATAGRGGAGAGRLARRDQPVGHYRPGGGAAVGRLVRGAYHRRRSDNPARRRGAR